MRLTAEKVIYFYMFICVALLMFNILYITRSKRVKRHRTRRIQWWERTMKEQLLQKERNPQSVERLFSRLNKIEELTVFHQVMEKLSLEYPKEAGTFFLENRAAGQKLAMEYGKRESMERAFLAYVIAKFYPPMEDGHDMLAEILLGYLENSTVYCRENVLCALYALGNGPAVEHAFEVLNEHGWYHHSRLLSDGMAKFSGSKAELVRRLWRHRSQWADFLVVAVVQFAAGLQEAFFEEFLPGLEEEQLSQEVRFALVRYFGHHICPECKPILLRFLQTGDGGESGLAIVAASALARYPGEDTLHGLMHALHSRNWYVRRNAAASLAALGISEESMAEIRADGDRYAIEMLEYMTENRAPRKKAERKEEG